MDRFDRVYFAVKNRTKYLKSTMKMLFDKSQIKCLKKNKKFENMYYGKRCFIIGNGPSLRTQDLSLLQDEYVFTVNYFTKSEQYLMVKSNFHILMDPAIFDFSTEYREERLKPLLAINTYDNKPLCFTQYIEKAVIEKEGLNQKLNVFYLNCGTAMYEQYKRKFDLTKVVPGFSNVILYATMIAMYMGFKKIYYIGCDMTGYEQIAIKIGKQVDLHVYKMSDQEKRMLRDQNRNMDAEEFFEGFFHMFEQYRLLRNYGKIYGIEMYNATQGGILDVLERVDYETLF